MSNSPTFVEHALDLVSLAGPVEARAMFGGHGLYHRGAMFGLLDDDELFLKTDAATVQRFLDAGCEPWVYVGPRGLERTRYYRPPDEAHEDAESMAPWARLAMDAALRAQAAKRTKPSRTRRAGRAAGPRRPAKGPGRRGARG